MRKTKKIIAVVLAAVMLFSMNMTAAAATITIEDGVTEGSTYSAYRLLDAKEKTTDDSLFLYSLNEKYSDVLMSVTGYTTSADIVNYIGGLDSEEIRFFADSVYAEIKAFDAEYTSESNQFKNVDPGYYLIVETEKGDETYSLVMLDTVGKNDVTITTKESVPELVKKVQERNDTTGEETGWQDGADYDIGDAVPFQLTGTLPDHYANYKTYYYAFHDTLSEGFTFNADSVVVKVENETENITIESTELQEGYEVVTTGLTDDCSFEIQFEDLKAIDAVSADSKIVVEYTATLTDKAVIGSTGNPNIAKLEYCNDPYFDGTGTDDGTGDSDGTGDGDEADESGHTSMTPEDKVIVFTYELDVNKVDKELQPLNGAGFTLYKLVMPNPNALGEGQTAGEAEEAEYVQIGDEIVGTEESQVTEFNFIGLDAGQYKLVETTVPLGFSQAEDVEFIVAADYDTDAADPKFEELTVEQVLKNFLQQEDADAFAVADGIISTDVVNIRGLLFPSAGGVGKIIFYIAGAAIMIGGVILLIRSRRMEENK